MLAARVAWPLAARATSYASDIAVVADIWNLVVVTSDGATLACWRSLLQQPDQSMSGRSLRYGRERSRPPRRISDSRNWTSDWSMNAVWSGRFVSPTTIAVRWVATGPGRGVRIPGSEVIFYRRGFHLRPGQSRHRPRPVAPEAGSRRPTAAPRFRLRAYCDRLDAGTRIMSAICATRFGKQRRPR